jgi:hypothetical protein
LLIVTRRKPVAKKSEPAGKAKVKKPASVAKSKKKTAGAPFNEQDPKRRLGNFGGAGEHPRQGSRTAGIVGQSKQKNHTDRSSDK